MTTNERNGKGMRGKGGKEIKVLKGSKKRVKGVEE
jgi:hypothetical protein